jgi:hypothetical protein
MPINPAFHRFSAEAAIIGRLLAAFGELEVTVCYNAAKAANLPLRDSVVAAVYRIRTTRSRLEAADALMRPIYSAAGLAEAYIDGFARVIHCLRIRNQFAHCNWGHDETTGLFFVDMQVAAESPDFAFHWKHVDVPLLERHETYFDGALEALRFADHEMAVKQGKLRSHFWPKPPVLTPPPLHNPEAQHIPPWLEPDEKARHIARARAAREGAPTPTPAQLAQEAVREAKRARRQADRERDLAKRSDPDSQQ